MAKAIDMTRPLAVFLMAVIGMSALCSPTRAQQAEDIGDFRVHYNTLNTNLLPPDVASAYGIQRSGSRAMLNIAVLRKAGSADSLDQPVRARVTASAVNLTGQRREIELREIEDQDAVYYIGTFRIHNEETLSFAVRVQPEGQSGPAREITFRQQFYTD